MSINSENIYFADEKIPARRKLNGETTFKDYSENWLNAGKNGLSPKTYSRYIELLRRVVRKDGFTPPQAYFGYLKAGCA